jgi:hypothetical protein
VASGKASARTSNKLSLNTPNSPSNGSNFGKYTFFCSGSENGEILKPVASHSLLYSKATSLSGVLAKVPTNLSL